MSPSPGKGEPAAPTASERRKRVLSGMRPTGHLHIGHYFGALKNWIQLQDEYECFYCVVDWHALTTDYADTSQIAQNTLEVAVDWLAAGLDPKRSTFFVQSQVPEHAELHLLLSMVTPLGWLERVPTYKEQIENIKDKNLHTYGFLGYPVLQAADIVMYDADLVPVGEDQVSHVELTREIVRRFNYFYGGKLQPGLSPKQQWEAAQIAVPKLPAGYFEGGVKGDFSNLLSEARSERGLESYLGVLRKNPIYFTNPDILTEPAVMLTETPRIPGTDGRKMSKSYGNAILLNEEDEAIRQKTKVMMTDPARKRRTDPGNPDVCPVYDWHKLFSPAETLEWAAKGCRSAGIGCIECKEAMADNLIQWIAPVRARRKEYESRPERVQEILAAGAAHARGRAQQTMARVRGAVFGASQAVTAAAPAAEAGKKAAR
ncbi:MAG TPA: tryptophan--tRNA ligase [Candidatus Acidoferrales bacterium]|nr:tryptophan--tRNA ligase [Candidatus Acidoferrales bacterium]